MNAPSATVLLNRLKAKARFRHLQVLVALGELASVRRTAEALGVSQPAVTQSLADLERLVDTTLFDRLPRSMRPTPAGQQLLPLARRMLDTLAEGSEALTALRQRGEGTVRVTAITGAIGGVLMQALPRFASAHPDVLVQVQECDPEQWGLQLARGEADVALVRQPAAVPTEFDFRPLLEDCFVVVCNPSHPMTRRRNVSWSALACCTWLPQAVGSAARATLDELMATWDVQPRMVQIVTRVSALTLSLVESLDVLALVPLSVVHPWIDRGQLKLVDVQPVASFKPLGLILPQGQLTRATATLVSFLERDVNVPVDATGPGSAARKRRPA
ncbi:MAG: HTH-type transcriptional regulator GbpR [Pseudomonadota bacterium]|jgi:DNA-binding transcriptional LysR family regulator